MVNIAQHLVELSNQLDKDGKIRCADAVDNLIKSASLDKVAQYVGVIGYVLRQNRAMGNCIRKKRVADSGSMQEIVLGCLKEYQDGNQYSDTEWASKYAQVVKTVPEKFSTAHLSFLSSLSSDNDMDTHIDNLREVTAMLKEAGVGDNLITQVLSHVDTLHEVLSKEGDSSRPFKVAAPRSPRKWWQRIFSPSKGDWWNFSGSGRGDDEDAKFEMSTVLENLRGITLTTQQMKTAIYRLQNQVAAQISMTITVDEKLQSVVSKINDLDLNSWSKTVQAVQQLEWLVQNTNQMDPRNQQSLSQAQQIAGNLDGSIRSIYEHITTIQENMYSLRQREAVRGRALGNDNPLALTSPSNEFGQLEKVLRQLYKNPFDDNSLHYAERMHGILDDKLRSIESNDVETQEYLQSINAPSPTNAPPAGDEAGAPEQPIAQAPEAVQSIDWNDPALKNIADNLSQGGQADEVIRLLNDIETASKNVQDQHSLGDAVGVLKAIRDLMINKSPIVNPVDQVFGNQPTAPTPEAQSPESQRSQAHTDANKAHQDLYGGTSRDLLDQISGKKKPPPTTSASNRKRTIIRIADAVDAKFPEIADLLDQYLEEHSDEIDKLPKIPPFCAIIKDSIEAQK